jgi:hypothetical protein
MSIIFGVIASLHLFAYQATESHYTQELIVSYQVASKPARVVYTWNDSQA